MPIANDKEIKSAFEDMASDDMVSEAGLGHEAFLPKGKDFIPSATSSTVHSNPCARRRARQPSFTSRSIEESQNSVSSYLATTPGNIVYGLSPMLDQSTKANFHPDNNIGDQTQFSHGDSVPGYFDTEASCHQTSDLCHYVGNGINGPSMTSMNSEPTENLPQTSSTQASYETRTDHFVHEAGQFSTESESERDVGFSGHSTSSSCQLETSPTEQEFCSAWSNCPIDWSDAEADICLHGNNRIDDLIYHFDKFFRGQIDNKLSEMGDFIHSLMTEQQTHVRYIVNTAVTNSQTLVSVEKDTTLGSPVRKMTRFSSGETVPGSQSVPSPVADHVGLTDDTMTPLFLDRSIQKDDERIRLLLKILATSCAVGGVLLRPEFHA